MTYKTIETETGFEVVSLITGKIIKKIPSSYKGNPYDFFKEWIGKQKFESKLKLRLKAIRKKEPLVFELVKTKEALGVRFVHHVSSPRFELIFTDGTKIKINEMLYLICENKLADAYLNY